MKKIVLFPMVLLGLLLLSGQAMAELKIGFLNVTKVTEESPQYKRARSSLQKDLDRREKELRSLVSQIKRLKDQQRKDGPGMKASEAMKLDRDIKARERKLQNARDEARDELALRQSEERNKLMRKVAEVVKAIGKKGKYDLILTDGVAYASDRVDISDEVLSRLKSSGR